MRRKCNATLVVGDDFGDNSCTFQCTRLYKHRGMHKVEFLGNRGTRIVRWDGDDRLPHERPEGGVLYYEFESSWDILTSLLDCIPYDNPKRESLVYRMQDLYDENTEFTVEVDRVIKDSDLYKELLSEVTSVAQSVLADRFNIVEAIKTSNPSVYSEFWLKPVR